MMNCKQSGAAIQCRAFIKVIGTILVGAVIVDINTPELWEVIESRKQSVFELEKSAKDHST